MEEVEIPPAKKPRLYVSPSNSGAITNFVDDMDDFYNTPPALPSRDRSLVGVALNDPIGKHVVDSMMKPPFRLPGLDLGTTDALPEEHGFILNNLISTSNDSTNKAFEKTAATSVDAANELSVLAGPSPAAENGGDKNSCIQLFNPLAEDGSPTSMGAAKESVHDGASTQCQLNGSDFAHGEALSTCSLSPLAGNSPSSELRKNGGYSTVMEHLSFKPLELLDLDPDLAQARSMIDSQSCPFNGNKGSSDTHAQLQDGYSEDCKTELDTQTPCTSATSSRTLLQGVLHNVSDNTAVKDPDVLSVERGILYEAAVRGTSLSNSVTDQSDGKALYTSMEGTAAAQEGSDAEFERDSSPIQLSTDNFSNTSLDVSSDDDYEMLDPAEQAHRLMHEDGGSEEEGGRSGAGNGHLRTLNEKPDEVVEKPNVVVTPDMEIQELGDVETLVENLALIKAKTSGEYQVLETGSLLCLENRTVIGVIAETLGQVQQPRYCVKFTNANAIVEAEIGKGTQVYYVPQFSTYVFTQSLKTMKGSDASNIHDEEVGDDELEFSDDDAEAEYRRNQKLQRQARRGGRGVSVNVSSRGLRSSHKHTPRSDDIALSRNDDVSISYDDFSVDDELYTPLARPSNLHEQIRQGQPPSASHRGPHNDRHRGGRSRGDFGKGRGGRGGGPRDRNRENGHHRGGRNGNGNTPKSFGPSPDLALPPTPQPLRPLPSPLFQAQQSTYLPQQQYQNHTYAAEQPNRQYQYTSVEGRVPTAYQPRPQVPYHFQPSYPPYPQPVGLPPLLYQAPFVYPTNQNSSSYSNGPTAPLPPGAFVNPAFFGSTNHQHLPTQQQFPPQYGNYPLPSNVYSNGRA
ncbi:hypothetical protein MMC13_008444 [Lambiella insularis]|nr:hypothetical protein [Lambiella insularis]